jgi:glycosyltransferase involved in cell wall biosynthesis
LRIAWYSNSPLIGSGYGTQTKMMLPRLKADGHDVAVLGLFGNQSGMSAFDTPDGPVPIFPMGSMHYGLDVVEDQTKAWLGDGPGWVITLYDVWVLGNKWANRHVASWTPIDHYPVTPGVLKWADKRPTIAMSKFGQRALAEAGINAPYIPHGIEADIWKPSPSDVRKQMDVAEDAFLVMINAANVGKGDRKGWNQNLRAFAEFARRHDDVVLYLHTDPTRPDGFPIASYLSFLAVPEERTRITDLFAYRTGLIPSSTVAELYTAADVLLAASHGEGFGLPVAESMACGTPAIVTDFSAQPEIIAETGWKVDCEPWWDDMQRSDFGIPSIYGILEALEESYAEKGTGLATVRSSMAEAHIREEYDADKVYAEKWRPLLAQMAEQLEEPKARQGMSKSAKRRMAKAAA